MTWEGYFTAGVLVALVASLVSRRISPDMAFLCALSGLLITNVLEPGEAVAGFANPAVITVGLLYIVAQGLKETGGMTTITRRLLGRPKSMVSAQVRLLAPVAGLSAFVNNTPVVAMFLPVLSGWARRSNLNASHLFMPLSFAAMLGGVCTLIGTSTNLVVNELLVEHVVDDPNIRSFGMFTLAWVGVPVAVLGLAYIIGFERFLIRVRESERPINTDPRRYTAWMKVSANGPIVGRTIEEAGLRHLRALFLASIERDGERLVAVGPTQILHAGDHLEFVGNVDSVVELQQMPGLEPDTEQINKLAEPRYRRRLTEAVVSESSPLVHKSVREGDFRNVYNAVIIAVHRAGERVRGKIGDIELRPGDTLLLEAPPGFAQLHRNSSAFYLVSERADAPTPRWGRAWLALGILAALVASITLGMDVVTAAICAAMLMVVTRCCTGTQARQSIDWQVLIVIGAAFGIARAMENTGVASVMAESILGWSATFGVHGMLAGVYLVTVLLTSVMTNNAAAALIFPIAYQFAAANGLDFMPFAVCIAIGASAAFMTPIGYQTNLMVMGPGGYDWWDFLRLGGPLTLLTGVICVVLSPIVYG